MFRENQSSDADNHRERREEYRRLVGIEQLLASLILIQQTFQYENTEVVTHTEDECGEYDIHDIELHSQNPHYSCNDEPTDRHRQETKKRKFQSSV